MLRATARSCQAFVLVDHLPIDPGEAALIYNAGADRTELYVRNNEKGAQLLLTVAGDHSDFDNFVL